MQRAVRRTLARALHRLADVDPTRLRHMSERCLHGLGHQSEKLSRQHWVPMPPLARSALAHVGSWLQGRLGETVASATARATHTGAGVAADKVEAQSKRSRPRGKGRTPPPAGCKRRSGDRPSNP